MTLTVMKTVSEVTNKYDDATTLEKADMHITDARVHAGNAGQAIASAVGDIQTAHGLSNNNLGHRLESQDLIAIAQVKATLALVEATLAVAHSNIGVYMINKGSQLTSMLASVDERIQDLKHFHTPEENYGDSGSEEVPEATPKASE